MTDRDKVIKGLECLSQKQEPTANPCKGCGYSDRPNYAICVKDIASDVLALLKEQEPRLMTLDELKEIYVEFKGENCPIRLTNFDLQKIVKYAVDGECRLWAGKPTDEQRQAVKWYDI